MAWVFETPDPPDYIHDEGIHRILRDAHSQARPEHRPHPPFHLGGPRPKLTAPRLAKVSLWCAAQARPYISKRNADEYDEVIDLARAVLTADQPDRGQINGLIERAHRGRSRVNPFPIAPITANAVYNAHVGFGDRASDSGRAAAKRLVRTLYRAGEDARVRPCLLALDQTLIRVEAQAAVDRYAPAPAPTIERVLCRIDRGNDTAGHFIVSLTGSEDLAAVTKLRNRYRFVRGSRDTVLATLPENVFDSGVEALLASPE